MILGPIQACRHGFLNFDHHFWLYGLLITTSDSMIWLIGYHFWLSDIAHWLLILTLWYGFLITISDFLAHWLLLPILWHDSLVTWYNTLNPFNQFLQSIHLIQSANQAQSRIATGLPSSINPIIASINPLVNPLINPPIGLQWIPPILLKYGIITPNYQSIRSQYPLI